MFASVFGGLAQAGSTSADPSLAGTDWANRWGQGVSMSTASDTLDGVEPLAAWIWDGGEPNPRNAYMLFRKQFDLAELPKDAHAYISAYAYADVSINGQLVERCPINCDPEYQAYDRFDILQFLKPGKNTVTALVHNYGVGLHSQMDARGGFFFQGKLTFADSESQDWLTDGSWKVSRSQAWASDSRFRDPHARLIGIVEEFDARLFPFDWQTPGFDDSAWENATVVGVPPVDPWNSLVVVQRPHLNRTTVKPVRQWEAEGKVVYDFGVEIVGYPEFTIDAKEGGKTFVLGTGERLDENNVPKLNVSSDHSETYTTKAGKQTWRPYTWSGFRYLSIEKRDGVSIENVQAEFACYDYEMGGSFACSDPQLTEFWQIGKHTMRINSIDVYQDPWREHTQYIGGDCRYMQIYGSYAFGKTSRLLSMYNILCGAQSQRWRDDGAVRSRYPTDYFMQEGSSTYIADYQLEWVLMMHEYFMHMGPDPLVEGLYPNMKKAMAYFDQYIDPETGMLAHIPGWMVLDWPSSYPMEKKDIVTGINCQYVGALNAAADIAEAFGNDPEQALAWRKQAKALKQSMNERLWSEEKRAYLDSYEGTATHQQPQIYALVYDLPDQSRRADMCALVKREGKASEQSFAYWTLNAMFEEGEDQWALDYMRENWGAQTKQAAFNGAWHEGWALDWGATSHAWSSGPTALLSQKVLGVEPTGWGFKTFSVKPHIGDLSWAKGTVNTVSGDIVVAWKHSEDGFSIQVTVPNGTTATVHLPTEDATSVQVDGKALNGQPSDGQLWESENTSHEDGRVVVTLEPGEHMLVCR